MTTHKSIIIAYSETDSAIVHTLKAMIADWFGDLVWMRDYDLNGGELVVSSLDQALEKAKWFILIISQNSLKSRWVQHEGHLATFQSIERMDFRVLIVKVDDHPYPKQFSKAVSRAGNIIEYTTIMSDRESSLLEIVEHIDKNDLNTRINHNLDSVFIDRGTDRDRFSLISRRNQIIFVVGWAGIGKTSFVKLAISQQLNRRALHITLGNGHTLDLLCRQIIQAAHYSPVELDKSSESSDEFLLNLALKALAARSTRFFLFLDNVEECVDPANRLHDYIELFLHRCVAAKINTFIILATTRNPDYAPSIGQYADVIRLGGIDDEYIKEIIDLLMTDSNSINTNETTQREYNSFDNTTLNDLAKLAGGHPLAAKMIVSQLRTQDSSALLRLKERKRFQLKLADHILRTTDQSSLRALHHAILESLSIVKIALTVNDIWSLPYFSQNSSLEELQEAVDFLAKIFLIEQAGETITAHNFIVEFYQEQANKNRHRSDLITEEFGKYAYHKVKSQYKLLNEIPKDSRFDDRAIELSSDILRYAIPASRLLRSSGHDDLASDLPLQIQGTIRAMVFHFYQDKDDYRRALDYAEQWLQIKPNDHEIALYRIRCHRRIGSKDSLAKAEVYLKELEVLPHNRRFLAIIYRERALIAERQGRFEEAKDFYRKGIKFDVNKRYGENHVGLARLLTESAVTAPFGERQILIHEALGHLEAVRKEMAKFDRFHLSLYIEVLMEAGYEEVAFPLLQDALERNPDDGKLCFRMAEILRSQGNYLEAEKFAKKAIVAGIKYGMLAYANTLYSMGMQEKNLGNNENAKRRFRSALEAVNKYQSQELANQEVAAATSAKIYRTLAEWDDMEKTLTPHASSTDPYLLYEMAQLLMHKMMEPSQEGRNSSIYLRLDELIQRIESVNYDRPIQLNDVLVRLKNLPRSDRSNPLGGPKTGGSPNAK